MRGRRVWLVTGAGSGIGASIAAAALSAGDAVVAAGRRPERIADALGPSDRILAARLDVTVPAEIDAAVATALDRFGRIDVVVHSAGASYKGYFEEMSPLQVERQLAVNLLGPMNVTRAVLPQMRARRSGHIVAISSGAGLIGFEYSSVYAASKAGLESWVGALADEVAPYGIGTTIVNPGWFRTELASPGSLIWPDLAVDDYAERSAAQREWWSAQHGRQPGDPAKLAAALIAVLSREVPPRRLLAGNDVVALARRKVAELAAQIDADAELSTSMAFDDEAASQPPGVSVEPG